MGGASDVPFGQHDAHARERERNLEKMRGTKEDARTFDGMFDPNPLGHDSVHLCVDVSCHAGYSSSRRTDLSLQNGWCVNEDDFAFRFWINGKLPAPSARLRLTN